MSVTNSRRNTTNRDSSRYRERERDRDRDRDRDRGRDRDRIIAMPDFDKY
jgi:hypothetical protein